MRGGSNVARGERERENVRFAFALMFRSPGACATRVSPIRGPTGYLSSCAFVFSRFRADNAFLGKYMVNRPLLL